MKTILLISIFSVVFVNSIGVLAQSRSAVSAPVPIVIDEKKEAELALKAKKHLYPGGKDEDDLKVQSALNKPARKISPTVEDKSEAINERD